MNLTKTLILSRLDRIVAGGDGGSSVNMDDPAVRAAIDAAVEKAVGGLKQKNAELLRKLDSAKTAEEKAEKYDAIVAERDQLTEKLEGLTKANKELKASVSKLTEDYTKESAYTQSLLIDGGLTDALSKVGVVPEFMPAVKAMLKEMGAKVVAEGDARKAVIGDKPLASFVSEWAQSDAGKHFVKAQANQGGGANGGQSGGGSAKLTAKPQRKDYGDEIAFFQAAADWDAQQSQ